MSNNSNPFDIDGEQVRNKSISNYVVKATVLDVLPDIHAVRVNPRGGDSPFVAPVLTPRYGSQVLPDKNERVTLLYVAENTAICLGSIYLLDGVNPPSEDSGDIIIGNESGAYVTITDGGDVLIESGSGGDVFIDGVKQ